MRITRLDDIAPNLLTTIMFFDIDTLKLRCKTWQQVDPFFQSAEVTQNSTTPDFTRNNAQHTRRIRKRTFGSDTAFCIRQTNQLHFTVKNGYEFNHALTKQLEEWDGTVLESAFSRNQEDGTTDYDLTVRRRKEISYSEMKEFIAKHEEIISATNSSAKK